MALMGVSMLLYVISDGYDLGVGMLMHRATAAEKDVLIASIGPFWDANETWLVLGIGILLVAFPKAHGVVLGELYLPVDADAGRPDAARRGLRLSRQGAATRTRRRGTACSSPARRSPSMSQGWMLGRYVSGFGSGWNYPLFAAAIALALPMAYVLLGAAWLIMKTEGELQRARDRVGAHRLGADGRRPGADLDGHAVDQRHGARALVLAARGDRADGDSADDGRGAAGGARAAATRGMCAAPLCWLPFVLLIGVFVLGFLGLAYSIYPFVVIDRLTIWQAASSPAALKVILIGVCISVPAIAGYTVFSYWVFRGKTGELKYA